jgi:hypothetical protein
MTYQPLLKWTAGTFTLKLWQTSRTDWRGQPYLAYKFYCQGKLVFKGQDFAGSPLHAIDSKVTVGALLGFLSLRPGDTDKEYFDTYSPAQLAFAYQHGEELSMLASDMENR